MSDGDEKRRRRRTSEHIGQEVVVHPLGAASGVSVLAAKLWDFAEGGVGLDVSHQLDVGQRVKLAADLVSPHYSLGFKAQGQVVHCRPIGKDRYRVGVAFLDVSYHRIPEKPMKASS